VKNPQRSSIITNNVIEAYLLGLFEGDGYTWTGTFGITNRNLHILRKASVLLSEYGEVRTRKDTRGPYRVCVVGRPLFRNFIQKIDEKRLNFLTPKNILPVISLENMMLMGVNGNTYSSSKSPTDITNI
jgi:intein/homing endonuclease